MSENGISDGGGVDGDSAWREAVPQSAGEQPITTAELDSLFEILASGQRRRLLAHLIDTDDGVATLPELAALIADGDDDRERATIRLHHTHLPKLEDEGVVEYDARSETVRYRGSEAVTAWVEFARR